MIGPALSLPRLIAGSGQLAALTEELAVLGSNRPLLVSDQGLVRAGIVAAAAAAAPWAASYLEVPENPTAAGADGAYAAFREAACDGVVAVGGGSVIDTAKIVAALARSGGSAADLIGRPDRITGAVPLVAIPTTLGSGSECSPVAALHLVAGGPSYGTRHPSLIPRTALCDPDLTRTLPSTLVAATAIDALSHCVEGYLAEPAHPLVDALALDGAARVIADVDRALAPGGEAARASLMAAAFAGGAAIHKGLGPAHAVALVCGDQHVHHGTLIGVALPHTIRLLARQVPDRIAGLTQALRVEGELADRLADLVASLGLPATLADAGYDLTDPAAAAVAMEQSHFNRTSPYRPSAADYRAILTGIAG